MGGLREIQQEREGRGMRARDRVPAPLPPDFRDKEESNNNKCALECLVDSSTLQVHIYSL